MPSRSLKTGCSFCKTYRNDREIVFEEPVFIYAVVPALALVLSVPGGALLGSLAGWLAKLLGAPVVPEVGLTVAIAGCVFVGSTWLFSRISLRHELHINTAEKSLTLLGHRLVGRTTETHAAATEVDFVELFKGEAKGADYFYLSVLLKDGKDISIDECTRVEQLMPLAEAISKGLGVPIVEKAAR